jgi:hypothetical protein
VIYEERVFTRKYFEKLAILVLGVSVTTEMIPHHRFGDRSKRDRAASSGPMIPWVVASTCLSLLIFSLFFLTTLSFPNAKKVTVA